MPTPNKAIVFVLVAATALGVLLITFKERRLVPHPTRSTSSAIEGTLDSSEWVSGIDGLPEGSRTELLATGSDAAAPSRSSKDPDMEEQEGDLPLDALVDTSGVSTEERLACLITAHDQMLRVQSNPLTNGQKAQAELMLLGRCVAAILHSSGRAHFADARDLERGGFRLRPASENEFVFAADLALYRFERGEFPVYDLAHERASRPDDDPLLNERPPGFDDQIADTYKRALTSLGAPETRVR